MEKTNTWRHSYDFDSFGEKERRDEVKRLHLQATFVEKHEMDYLAKLNIKPDMKILEVGCGPGFITGMLASLVPQGFSHGLDMSDDLLEVARGIVKPKVGNVDFFKGSCYELPFKNQTYDFVYNRLIYQHLKDPIKALTEATRVSKKGGKISIVDIDSGCQLIYPLSGAFDELNNLALEAQMKNDGDRFIGRKLPGLLKSAGLKDIAIDVITLTSLDTDVQRLLDVTTRFKAMLVGTPQAAALLNKINLFCDTNQDELFVMTNVFCVSGIVC